MTFATRRSLLVASVAVLMVAACDPGSASPTPSASASAAASASSAGTVAPSAPPSVPATTPSPAATPAPSTACVVVPQNGVLPSDRFTDIKVESTESSDKLTFVFGDPSLPGPPAPPKGSLEIATPPYTLAGSGEPIEVNGEHVLQIVFSGMSLSNDVGQETYVGPRGIEEPFPALRHAAIYDMSEGVVGWYVGYDGGGCATLSQTSNEVTLTIQHPWR